MTTDTRIPNALDHALGFAPVAACEAHDLKRLLTTIADQIADADKRHSEALGVVQQRLAVLGDEAAMIRARAPQSLAPAIERIEDRMAELSDKIAVAEHPRSLAPGEQPAALRSAGTDHVGAFTRRDEGARAAANPAVDPFDVVSFDGSDADREPWDPATAEALTRVYEGGDIGLATDGDLVEHAGGARITPNAYDVAHAAPAARHHDAPAGTALWSDTTVAEQAATATPAWVPAATADPRESLSLAITLPPAAASHEPARFSEPARFAEPTRFAEPNAVTPGLDQRFAEIAAKLELSLASFDPESSVNEFNERFTQLEQRLSSAIGETATRGDQTALKSIEQQVEDLTSRLDAVQSHFSRLDAIEHDLRSLAEQSTEDNLTRLFKSALPAQPEIEHMPRIETALQSIAEQLAERHLEQSQHDQALAERGEAAHGHGYGDPHEVAELVAARLGEQLARSASGHATAPSDGSAQRIEDLRTMLNGFIEEQRHGDEQTTTMLDTMQQAMIRLLDRMDAIESFGPAHATSGLPLHSAPDDDYGAHGDAIETAPAFGRRGAGATGSQTGAQTATTPTAAGLDASEPASTAGAHGNSDGAQTRWPQPWQSGAHSKSADQPDTNPAASVTSPSDDATAHPLDLGAAPEPMLPTGAAHDPAVHAAGSQVVAASSTSLNREEFIAAARRAARQAAAQTPAEPTLPDEDEAPPAGKGVGATSRVAMAAGSKSRMPRPTASATPDAAAAPAKETGKSAGKAAKPSRFGQQPSMMTVGLVCMITVGATFMLARPFLLSAAKSSLDPSGVAAQTTQQPDAPKAPAAATAAPAGKGDAADKAKPDLGDGEEIIDNGAQPKRSSLPQPYAVGETLDSTGQFVKAAVPADGGTLRTEDLLGGQSEQPGSIEMPPLMIGPNSLRLAASKGDPSAQFEVGARFAEGKGVPQDLKQAVVWYQRAASQGFAAAQYRLASMYERGLGAKIDLAKAALWYQRAAEQGNVKAMHNLAVLRAGRDGVPTDYAAAAHWFTLASDYGLTDSQFNLAIMNETGLGMDSNLKQAYKWFALAARAGDAEASRRRDAVRAKLAPAELRQADVEIEGWRAKVPDVAINDTRVAGEAWKRAN